MKTIIKVLASDFEGNNYFNLNEGELGCPLMRGIHRQGFKYRDYGLIPEYVNLKVEKMFNGELPIEDFSFEMDL